MILRGRPPRRKLLVNRTGVETLLELPVKIQKQALRKMETIEATPAGEGYPLRKPLQGLRSGYTAVATGSSGGCLRWKTVNKSPKYCTWVSDPKATKETPTPSSPDYSDSLTPSPPEGTRLP